MSNISKAIKTTRIATSILTKARNKMLKSSFHTAKQIAGLYKDAGIEAYTIGKKVVSKTVKLTIDNQKELIQTSSEALKAAAKSIRETEVKEEKKPKGKRGRKKKDVTIEELL
ncbi:MAG: hypothetical protein AAF985_07755 [Bacteroidota bacterium]